MRVRVEARFAPLFAFAMWIAVGSPANGDDWPQWMGPQRDGVYTESGVVEQFPKAGLKVQWRQKIAGGYAGPSVAGKRVFVFDFTRAAGEAFNDPSRRAEVKGTERLLCLDARTGSILWRDEQPREYKISYPAGPRCTPTVDGDLVYSLGAEGDLRCLRVEDGTLVWARQLSKEYSSEVPLWGHSAHPLIDGPRIVCMVGGKGKGVVAFDKRTGEEMWRSVDTSGAGYAPPSLMQIAGKKQLVVFHPEGLAGLEPETGKPIWTLDLKPDYEMSIARPQAEGDLIYASGIGSQSVLFRVSGTNEVTEMWRGDTKSSVFAGNATPLLHGGVIYGSDCQLGAFMAVDTRDGKRLWTDFAPTHPGDRRVSHGTAFATRRGEQFWLMSETGELILAKVNPERYEELGRSKVLAPTGDAFGRPVVWSHPAYADRAAFCRNDQEIVRVSLAASDY